MCVYIYLFASKSAGLDLTECTRAKVDTGRGNNGK